MRTIEIKRVKSKWLINGKQYHDSSDKEKAFFDGFISIMKTQS